MGSTGLRALLNAGARVPGLGSVVRCSRPSGACSN